MAEPRIERKRQPSKKKKLRRWLRYLRREMDRTDRTVGMDNAEYDDMVSAIGNLIGLLHSGSDPEALRDALTAVQQTAARYLNVHAPNAKSIEQKSRCSIAMQLVSLEHFAKIEQPELSESVTPEQAEALGCVPDYYDLWAYYEMDCLAYRLNMLMSKPGEVPPELLRAQVVCAYNRMKMNEEQVQLLLNGGLERMDLEYFRSRVQTIGDMYMRNRFVEKHAPVQEKEMDIPERVLRPNTDD